MNTTEHERLRRVMGEVDGIQERSEPAVQWGAVAATQFGAPLDGKLVAALEEAFDAGRLYERDRAEP